MQPYNHIESTVPAWPAAGSAGLQGQYTLPAQANRATKPRIGPFYSGLLAFPNRLPIGGHARAAVSNGVYSWSGRLHNSGYLSYEAGVVLLIKTAAGLGFLLSAARRLSGTIEAGSRDFAWNVSGESEALASALEAGGSWTTHWGAAHSRELDALVEHTRQALGVEEVVYL